MRDHRNSPSARRRGCSWSIRALSITGALLAAPLGAAAQVTSVTVVLDRAQVMPLPPTTATIIVGNPIIADVTMLRQTGQVILTGKGYGDTNLLFIDGRGALLGEAHLQVRQAPTTMIVQRGPDRESYACHPRCEPTVALGDSSTFLQQAVKDVQLRNGLASGAAMGMASGAAR